MELHPRASQTASIEESPGSRRALPGGLPCLHRYPLGEGVIDHVWLSRLRFSSGAFVTSEQVINFPKGPYEKVEVL